MDFRVRSFFSVIKEEKNSTLDLERCLQQKKPRIDFAPWKKGTNSRL